MRPVFSCSLPVLLEISHRAFRADHANPQLGHTTLAMPQRYAHLGRDLIATLLGHSTLAMTQRYAHLGREELRAAVGQFEPILKPPPADSTGPSE
jgi:integrase